MSRHYVVIDEYSGYVWGECDAESPLSACLAIDANIDGKPREYESIGRAAFNGREGYLVYEAPTDFIVGGDGQDPAYIEAVETLPLVDKVVVYRSREDTP